MIYAIMVHNIGKDVLAYFSVVQGYGIARQPENIEVFIYIILATFPSFLLPIYGKKPSSLILWFVYYSHIIPAITLYPLKIDGNYFWSAIIILFYCTTIYCTNATPDLTKKLKTVSISTGLYFFLVLLVGTCFIAILIITFGFNFSPPSITDVYKVREEYVNNSNFISGYAAIIGGFVICPLLSILAITAFKNSKGFSLFLFLVSSFLAFQIYANSGFKSVAFASIACILCYFIFRKIKNFGVFISTSLPTLLLVLITFSAFLDIDILLYHWFRRVFLVPGINVNYYYDYIMQNNLLFIENAPNTISNYYYGTDGSANAGLVGDALARFSYVGLFVNGIVYVMILKIADYASMEINSDFATALFVPTAYAISNSSISTIFISYGFLFLCIFLIFSRKVLNKILAKS